MRASLLVTLTASALLLGSLATGCASEEGSADADKGPTLPDDEPAKTKAGTLTAKSR